MEIVGARINTSPGIDEMIEKRDKAALIDLCQEQLSYGATRIALNCGTRLATEVEDMLWMAHTLQDEMEVLLMPDTPNPLAIQAVVEANRYGRVLVDSTTCEQQRIEAVMPLVQQYNCQIAVLLQDESGMPKTVEDRLRLMEKVEQISERYQVPKQDMFLDCLVFPLALDYRNGQLYAECIQAIRREYPGYRFTCGLNNISYGLPNEPLLNNAFLLFLLAMGQDCIFLDIDRVSGAFLQAAKAILGEDEYTMDYIQAYKEGKFPTL